MSAMARLGLAAILLAAAFLAGCANTPQPALDQANNGTYLMTALQAEIGAFRANEALVGELRVAAVRDAQIRIARMESNTADDDRIYLAAGKKAVSDNFAKIVGLVDARAKDEKSLDDKVAAIDKAFAELLAPLPDGSKELAEAQKSLAILGNELSTEERLKTFAGFAKEIKKSVDENQKKIDEAKKNAASGGQQ
jgi:hypothetical protein